MKRSFIVSSKVCSHMLNIFRRPVTWPYHLLVCPQACSCRFEQTSLVKILVKALTHFNYALTKEKSYREYPIFFFLILTFALTTCATMISRLNTMHIVYSSRFCVHLSVRPVADSEGRWKFTARCGSRTRLSASSLINPCPALPILTVLHVVEIEPHNALLQAWYTQL